MARLSYNGISGYIVYKIITFQIGIFQGGFTMKCIKCHNIMDMETGEK